jgi:hypothetical protein
MRSPGSVGIESPDGVSKSATALRLKSMENLQLVFDIADNRCGDVVVVPGVRLLLKF